MIYVDFSAGGKDYKLRLNTRSVIMLEKQIGCNPIAIFGDGETIPTITTMVAILNASLQQYNHGITLNDAYDIYDAWLADGHTATDFIKVIIELYKVSGLIADNRAGETEKN
jgi:hypothetical protein